MAFNKNRMAKVGGFENNCALNALVHVLLSKSADDLGDVPGPAQNSILQAFNRKYGTTFTTFAEMIAHLKGLTPSERETKLGPVLRSIFRDAYDAGQRANPHFPTIAPEQLTRLLTPGTLISDDELNYVAWFLGMNLQSYVGDDVERDYLSQGERPNPFSFRHPIATLKLWQPTVNSNHFSFEAPSRMDVQAHNVAMQPIASAPNSWGSAAQNAVQSVLGKVDSLFSGMFGGQAGAQPGGNAGSVILNSLFSFIGPILKMFLGFTGLFKELGETALTPEQQEIKKLENDLKLATLRKQVADVNAAEPAAVPPTPEQQLEQQIRLARLNKEFAEANAPAQPAPAPVVPALTPAAQRQEALAERQHELAMARLARDLAAARNPVVDPVPPPLAAPPAPPAAARS